MVHVGFSVFLNVLDRHAKLVWFSEELFYLFFHTNVRSKQYDIVLELKLEALKYITSTSELY